MDSFLRLGLRGLFFITLISISRKLFSILLLWLPNCANSHGYHEPQPQNTTENKSKPKHERARPVKRRKALRTIAPGRETGLERLKLDRELLETTRGLGRKKQEENRAEVEKCIMAWRVWRAKERNCT
jgi:hypothetical protein